MSVRPGTACALKSHAFIESDCLSILLVHIGSEIWMHTQGVPEKETSDTGSSMGGIYKQCLHVTAVQQHESDDPVLSVIYGNPQQGLRQETGQLFFYVAPIVRRKKVMGSVYGSAPDIHNAFAVFGNGSADSNHFHIYDFQVFLTDRLGI